MPDKEAVKRFFTESLLHKSPPGRFEITKNKTERLKNDLCKGEKLVFTYQAKLVYLGYADSGVILNTEPNKDEYPSYFLVDVKRIYPAQGSLKEFRDKLLEEGIETKIGGPNWTKLKEDSQELKEKLKKIWEFFIYSKKTDISIVD